MKMNEPQTTNIETIPEVLLRFMDALVKAVPLLDDYEPPGFSGFRDGTPMLWRGGLFVRTERGELATFEGSTYVRGLSYFKAYFGSEMACKMVALTVGHLISRCGAGVDFPIVAPPGAFWGISFHVPTEMLPELTAAIDPPIKGARDAIKRKIAIGVGPDVKLEDHLL